MKCGAISSLVYPDPLAALGERTLTTRRGTKWLAWFNIYARGEYNAKQMQMGGLSDFFFQTEADRQEQIIPFLWMAKLANDVRSSNDEYVLVDSRTSEWFNSSCKTAKR